METEVVWLVEERTFAYLLARHAHVSIVRYTRGGIDYEVQVPNDEIEFNGEEDNDDED